MPVKNGAVLTTQDLQLTGRSIRLEPTSPEHVDDLAESVADGRLWERWYTVIPRPEAVAAEIESRLARRDAGIMLPLTVVDQTTGRAVGLTSFYDLDPEVPRCEIGFTWIRGSAQGTAVNPEAKLLMLGHAFDVWGCEAVGFRTQSANHQSQAALSKLGARRDGVMRAAKRRDGTLVDVVLFSVLRHEWPEVQRGLAERLTSLDPGEAGSRRG